MNRRRFLAFLGIGAAVAPLAKHLPVPPESVVLTIPHTPKGYEIKRTRHYALDYDGAPGGNPRFSDVSMANAATTAFTSWAALMAALPKENRRNTNIEIVIKARGPVVDPLDMRGVVGFNRVAVRGA